MEEKSAARMNRVPFSIYGVPLLGLMGLLACLWHPQLTVQAAMREPQMEYLVQPDSALDRSMTIFLRQEAKDVAYSRKHDLPAIHAQAISDYNLVAQECTPAVFKTTHLPQIVAF